MPKSISGGINDGVFPNILVNVFAARINSAANSFLVYNNSSLSPLFKIDGQTNIATFQCDLNVIGNATFTTVSNIDVTESMISLANSNTVSDLIDIGFYGQYNSSGIKYRGLVKSISLGRWILFKDITTMPSTAVSLTGSYQDNLEVNDLYFGGSGYALSTLKTDVDGFPDSLKDLTSTEISQLTNINSNAISSTQWGYLSSADQSISTNSNLVFNNLTVNGNSLLQNTWLNNRTLYMRDSGDFYHYIKFNAFVNGIQYAAWQGHLWTSESVGANLMYLNSYGGLTVGTSDIASSTYKLYVNGVSYFNSTVTVNGTINATTLGGTLSTVAQPNITSATGLVTIASATNAITLAGTSVAATAWTYVNSMNQAVASSSSPTFITVNANLTGNVTGNCSGTAATVTAASQSAITTLPNLASIQGQSVASTAWPHVNTMNQPVASSSSPTFITVNANLTGNVTGNCSGTAATVTTAAQPTITSLGTLTTLTMGGNIISDTTNTRDLGTTLNVWANIYATALIGTLSTNAQPNITSLAGLTSIQGQSVAAVTWQYVNTMNQPVASSSSPTFITVNATTLAGTLSTTAQPNIISLAGLTSIQGQSIASTAWQYVNSMNQPVASSSSPSFVTVTANLTGNCSGTAATVTTAAQPAITSVGTLTGLTMGGTLNLATNNITNGGTITATTLAGTLSTASQSAITSVGTLTALTTSGVLTCSAGTVGAPSINLGDSTTGWYRSALNNISIAVSGSRVATWSSTGLAMNTLAISGVSTLTATTLGGTLSTAAQTAITSVGTLTGLTMSGNIAMGGFQITNIGTATAGTTTLTTGGISDSSGSSIATTASMALAATTNLTLSCGAAGVTTITRSSTRTIQVGSGVTYDIFVNTSGLVSIGSNTNPNSRQLFVNGDVEATNFRGALVGNASTATTAGTVTTAAQPTITSVGTLTALTLGGVLTCSAGTVGTPSINLGDSTTGWYRSALNNISIAVSSSRVATWSSTGLAMNTLAISGVSTLTATTLGGTLSTAAQTSITSVGTLSSLTLGGVITGSAGTVGAPSLNFSDSTTGWYRFGSNSLAVAISGAAKMIINSSGNMTLGATDLASTTNTLYVNGNARFGSTVSGAFNGNTNLSVNGAFTTYTNGYAYGIQCVPSFSASQASTEFRSLNVESSFTAGGSTLTNAVGTNIYNNLSSNSGTITNAIGIYVNSGSNGTGTITNAYGAYISTPSHGTNRYAMYVSGGITINTVATDYYATLLTGNLIALSSSYNYSFLANCTIAPASNSTGCRGISSQTGFSVLAGQTMNEASGIFISSTYSSNLGTINNAYGLLVSTGSTGVGITNSYGIYCSAPAQGTNRYPLYVSGAGSGSGAYHIADFLSGASGTTGGIYIGRASTDCVIGAAATSSHYFGGTSAGDAVIRCENSTGKMWIGVAGANGAFMNSSGQFVPEAKTQDLGTGSLPWRVIYYVTLTAVSDRNKKNTIQSSNLGLDFINQLNPVSYKYNDDDREKTHYGLIAQDVKHVLEENKISNKDFAGYHDPADGDEEGPKGLSYIEFICPMIKAIQELSATVKKLSKKNNMMGQNPSADDEN